MAEAVVTLKNPSGLHARPASQFVQTAGKFKGTTVRVAANGKEIDAKSILAIMGLGARQGTELTLKAEGPDAEAAVAALVALVESGFGEV
jgi:phosphocarrier protein